jgi:hypothetical protein
LRTPSGWTEGAERFYKKQQKNKKRQHFVGVAYLVYNTSTFLSTFPYIRQYYYINVLQYWIMRNVSVSIFRLRKYYHTEFNKSKLKYPSLIL